MIDRETMLYEIMALDFAGTDLNLYLDTHPDDKDSIELYNVISKKRTELVKSYETMFGPIDPRGYVNSDSTWDWIENPWPWNKPKDGRC